jgi:predicted nucleotidyltransferase component of viral defense system
LIQVYSLEEIASEKTVTLIDRARNEPRDLYDLWHLTSNQGIQLDHLTGAKAHARHWLVSDSGFGLRGLFGYLSGGGQLGAFPTSAEGQDQLDG